MTRLLSLVAGALSLVPGLCAWGAWGTSLVLAWPRGAGPVALACAAAPAVLAAAFLLALAALGVVAPTVRAGRFSPSLGLGWVAWTLQRHREQAARRAGLLFLMRSFYVLRFLHARALGAHMHLQVNAALDNVQRALPLITVGRGATLALGSALVAGRTDADGGVELGPIVIGAGAFIGADTRIGPGTTVGDAAWIGYGNALVAEEVAAGTKIPDRARDPGPEAPPW